MPDASVGGEPTLGAVPARCYSLFARAFPAGALTRQTPTHILPPFAPHRLCTGPLGVAGS